jgi:hypothetical protein
MIRRGDLDGRPPGVWPSSTRQARCTGTRATIKVAPTDGDGTVLGLMPIVQSFLTVPPNLPSPPPYHQYNAHHLLQSHRSSAPRS